jgi:excisionase family DNA binding protein
MPKFDARSSRALSIADFADELGVDRRTVQRWIKSGALHALRIGGVVRITDEDVRAFKAAWRT